MSRSHSKRHPVVSGVCGKGGRGLVFERFTERARQVVVLAQDEARALKHNYIGTEHILLGLLREEEGLAARVLESLDITVEERSEEHTSELQSRQYLVCRLL